MSLYNLLFGRNPNTEIVLAIIGVKESDVQRFRDCGFTKDNEIYVYTRTGGGNRADYPNKHLTSSPYYKYDRDDDFDRTYATYYFNIPDHIKDDVLAFQNVRENGISGKLIQWIIKTLEREPTEGDKHKVLWDEQARLVHQAKQVLIHESNGHTITPLDDRSLEKFLELMEQNNGEQLGYSVVPYKVYVENNVPRWLVDADKPDSEKEMCRVKFSYGRKWEIDKALWEHWETKYSEKYPNAIATIKEDIRYK